MTRLFVAATAPELACVPGWDYAESFSNTPWPCKRSAQDIFLESGAGPANAAGALAWAIAKFSPGRAFGLGIAGSYPNSGLELGDVVQVATETFGDLGAWDGDQWLSASQLGWPLIPPARIELQANSKICRHMGGCTVSACTGSAARALALELETGAAVESMEGAAWASTCLRMGIPLSQWRSVSNRVGPRDRNAWRIDLALENLRRAVHAELHP